MNISDNHEQFGEGVIYKDIVPLKWRELGRNEAEFSYPRVQKSNDEVLRFITILDEFHADGYDETGSVSGSDLGHLEFKLDLLLDMVTQMMTRESDIPESFPMTLGSAGVEWITREPLKAGTLLELSLYLHHKYPRPFIVRGKVSEAKPAEDELGKYLIQFVFEQMSDVVQAGLERLIFRQHRRSIAQSRRAVNTLDENP